jgi:hypothetical protein
VNWDIEEELWRFQDEIEGKYQQSEVNSKYAFPRNYHDESPLQVNIGSKSSAKNHQALIIQQ